MKFRSSLSCLDLTFSECVLHIFSSFRILCSYLNSFFLSPSHFYIVSFFSANFVSNDFFHIILYSFFFVLFFYTLLLIPLLLLCFLFCSCDFLFDSFAHSFLIILTPKKSFSFLITFYKQDLKKILSCSSLFF